MKKEILLIAIYSCLTIGAIHGQNLCQSMNTPNECNFAFPFGQSMTMTGCTGDYFHSFTFSKCSASSGMTINAKIYNGESDDPANLMYQQDNIPVIDGMGTATITFTGGSGTLAIVPGQQYSIIFDINGGAFVFMNFNRITGTNNAYPDGSMYQFGSFTTNSDLQFEVFTTTVNPVPVELTYFKGESTNEGTRLTWQTASEENNVGFEIQHSTDAKNWQVVDFVEGQGTTLEVQNYTFMHEVPVSGTNYYRLKQLDFDGEFEYSKIVTIEYQMIHKELRVFPNPVGSQFTLIGGQGNATIYNALGQPVKRFIINNKQMTVNTSDLTSGQYLLQIRKNDESIETLRFIK